MLKVCGCVELELIKRWCCLPQVKKGTPSPFFCHFSIFFFYLCFVFYFYFFSSSFRHFKKVSNCLCHETWPSFFHFNEHHTSPLVQHILGDSSSLTKPHESIHMNAGALLQVYGSYGCMALIVGAEELSFPHC